MTQKLTGTLVFTADVEVLFDEAMNEKRWKQANRFVKEEWLAGKIKDGYVHVDLVLDAFKLRIASGEL